MTRNIKTDYSRRAALAAAPAQPVEMTDDEKRLRRMLCVAHAGALAYMDDGEASDSRMHPTIDFLRDSPEDIQRKIWERNRAALAAAPAQPVPSVQWQCGPQANGFAAPQVSRGQAPAGATPERQYISPVSTVADLVNNLMLMDQSLPIYGAQPCQSDRRPACYCRKNCARCTATAIHGHAGRRTTIN